MFKLQTLTQLMNTETNNILATTTPLYPYVPLIDDADLGESISVAEAESRHQEVFE